MVLQLSRFPWGDEPGRWLREIALAADEAGFAGLALMDHLIQIPQVGAAWEPIPEPWVTLGLLAGLDTRLRLGTLVSPVTLRPPGVVAKTAATLDALSGGRAFCGVGAGWWEREHLAFGLPFPPPAERLDRLETAIETMRALWAPGTKAYDGGGSPCPRPRATPARSARCRSSWAAPASAGPCGSPPVSPTGATCRSDDVDAKTEVLRRHCAEVGRDPAEVAVTVLDLPVVGRDREDVWQRVERLRGRTPAATYARRHHAGTPAEHRTRYGELADRGVATVFVALPDLERPEDLLDVAAMLP